MSAESLGSLSIFLFFRGQKVSWIGLGGNLSIKRKETKKHVRIWNPPLCAEQPHSSYPIVGEHSICSRNATRDDIQHLRVVWYAMLAHWWYPQKIADDIRASTRILVRSARVLYFGRKWIPHLRAERLLRYVKKRYGRIWNPPLQAKQPHSS